MKDNFYLTIYNKIKEGKNPKKISEELSISKQKVNYYIRQLKNNELIKRIGYGTWSIIQDYKDTFLKHKRIIRGHAFIWKIKIPEELKELLKEKLIELNLGLAGKTPRIIINEKKVWFGKKNIIVYENKSFYGKNSLESKKYAVISLLETLGQLENKFRLKITPLLFSTSKEHYGMIRNDLAIQCNRNKERIYVKDDLEGTWFWIDNSESLGEIEVSGSKAIVRSKQVQDWWNDNKKHNFKVTPTFLMESLNGLIQTQQMNADNIIKHQNVLDEMLITLKKIQETLNAISK